MRGVGRALGAVPEHRVIGRNFAFRPQPRAGPPDKGVEPIHGADDFRQQLGEPVTAPDVRELVVHYGRDAVGRPRFGKGGDDQCRTPHAPHQQQ